MIIETDDALQRLVKTVTMPSHAPIRVVFDVEPYDPMHRKPPIIVALCFTMDRDHPVRSKIILQRKCHLPKTSEEILDMCRILAHECFAHECDEFLQVLGQRVWDPHKRGDDEI